MSGQMPRLLAPTALVAALLVGGGVGAPADRARADDCLTAPNGPAPQGNHWYYRTERGTDRKCWYLRTPIQPSHAAAQPAADAAAAAPAKASAPVVLPSAPPAPAAGAPATASSGDAPPLPAPRVKILNVKPKPAPVLPAPTDDAQRGTADADAAPSPSQPAAPQVGTAPMLATPATAAAPSAPSAPSAPAAWPPAATPPQASEQVGESSPTSDQASTDAAGARASDNGDSADSVAESTDESARAGKASVRWATPLAMFLILAFGIATAGILAGIAMKVFAARRARVIVDQAESEWAEDQYAGYEPYQHQPYADEYPDRQHERQEPAPDQYRRPQHADRRLQGPIDDGRRPLGMLDEQRHSRIDKAAAVRAAAPPPQPAAPPEPRDLDADSDAPLSPTIEDLEAALRVLRQVRQRSVA